MNANEKLTKRSSPPLVFTDRVWPAIGVHIKMTRIHESSVLVVCGIIATVYLSALRLFFFRSGGPDFPPFLRRRPQEYNTNLLIIAHGRSGSSFLGQLFNKHADVFYVYEPLSILQATTLRHSSLYEQSALRLMEDILKCNFQKQKEFLSFLSSFPLNRFSSEALTVPFCKNITDLRTNRTLVHCENLGDRRTSTECLLRKHRVIKVLSHRIPNMTVDAFKSILKSIKKLKIIHLMRDPRAIVASMKRVGLISENNVDESRGESGEFPTIPTPRKTSERLRKTAPRRFHQQIQKFCLSTIDALAFALEAERELKDRYTLVRYEDLVADVRRVARSMYEFAEIPFLEKINKWILKSTHTWSRGEYTTFRNDVPSRVDSWKKELGNNSIRVVERYCWPVLEILRYTPLHTLESL